MRAGQCRRLGSILLLAALAVPLWTGAGQAGEQLGIAVEMGVQPVAGGAELREGQEATFRFRIADAATGTPLSGVSPAAWLAALGDSRRDAATCAEEVQQFLSGSFLQRPAVDLNAYYLLTLNEDASISVLDPLSGFGGSRLLAQVLLKSPGADWVLSPDRSRLYVSEPVSGKVAAVDTASWRVLAEIDAGAQAGRLALEPDGSRLWVATASGATAIDTERLAVRARLAAGSAGTEHDLALTEDGRRLFVVSHRSRTLTAIDTARLARLREVKLSAAPTAVAWSPLARAAYVVASKEGKVFAVDGERLQVTATLAAQPGLGRIRFAPGGRLGLIPNPQAGRVHVLDAAVNRFVQSGEMEDGPDQITFSSTLAYVRQRRSDSILMVPLAGLGEAGRPLPVADFTGGQHPPVPSVPGDGSQDRRTLADSIVRAPEPGTVLVANPADEAIYYYREGMAAPMGSFQVSGHPRAVLVVDRSLREGPPGSYEAVASLPAPGRYRAVFFLDSPRTVQCFEVTIAADPVLAEKRLRERPLVVVPQLASTTLPAGKPARFRFRLTDPGSGRPVDDLADVQVLAFRSSGTWQARRAARPVGDGMYEAEVSLPAAGSYHVAVESLAGRLSFNRSPQIVLRAVDEKAP